MTFDELLGRFAPQSQAAWQQAAQREWRGRPAADFALSVDGDLQADEAPVVPFAATHPSGGPPPPAPSAATERIGWVPVSDLRARGPGDLDPLAELTGGAQGLIVGSEQLAELRAEALEVRFDFLHLLVFGNGEGMLDALTDLIPVQQAGEVELRLPLLAAQGTELVRLASRFPRVRWMIDLGADSPTAQLANLRRHLTTLSGEEQSDATDWRAVPLTVCYTPPADYIYGVCLPGAMRDVWLAWCDDGGGAGHPPQLASGLEILATVTPARAAIDRKLTAEGYSIDATVRVTAAASGGADFISVASYGSERRYRREARNLQQVLLLESGLPLARDVTRGAALLQRLRERLVAAG